VERGLAAERAHAVPIPSAPSAAPAP
jgi:hypothetical protein